MSTRVCGRCRRPLPAPASEGAAPAPCPFCVAQGEAARVAGGSPGRTTQARTPAVRDDAAAPKKRAEAFASALSENATRTTPVHSFAVPPEAIPVVHQPRRREPPPPPTPPPVVLPPPPAPLVTILPPSAAPQPTAAAPPPAPPPRRAAAVTATLASFGPGPFTQQASSAAPAAASMVAAFAVAPAVAPPVAAPPVAAPAPYLVAVATPAPVSVAAAPAPAARVAPAAALAETMLSLSYDPRAAAAATASPAERGDAWNISSYLDGAGAPAASNTAPESPPARQAPEVGAISQPQPSTGSEPIDLQIRGGMSAFLHRLPTRGLGAAAIAALVVIALGAGAFVLLGGPLHSGARKSGADTRAAKSSAKSSAPASIAPVATAPRVAAAQLPSLVMPPLAEAPATAPALPPTKAVKAVKARAPEPEAAPPPVEEEAPIAAAPARSRGHSEAKVKAKAVSKRAVHHASASSSSSSSASSLRRGGAHRRSIAHARASASDRTASETDESDKMARARDAHGEGNERLFSGDAAGAITAYEEMVRLNPKDPAGYRGLGLASAQLGKRTEAVRYLRAYLKHAPNAEDRGIIISRISLLQTLPP